MDTTALRRLTAITVSVTLAGGLALMTNLPAAAAVRCTGAGIAGDVNGDNRAEVAATQLGRDAYAGAVHVFYGTSGGLVTDATGRARDDQFIDQSTPLVPGSSEPADEFGAATVFGDFDADGCADLAVGSPGEDDEDGAVTVLYGSPAGLATTSAQRLSLTTLFDVEPAESRFGSELVTGDFNHDAVADLAVGIPGLDLDPAAKAGAVAVIYGNEEGGLDTSDTPADLLTRDTPGIPGAVSDYEAFGTSLAAGDFDGNGVDQLAIVSPGSFGRLGSIQVVERGPAGFNRPQPTPIGQAAAQGHGQSKVEDSFGASAAAGQFNADPYADLAVGAPGRGCLECDEEWGSGEVVVLSGSASGLTATGRQLWTQNSSGIPGRAEPGDGFGYALVAENLDGGDADDLAVGAPEDAGTGSVTVLVGSPRGLTTVGYGGTTFTQETPGLGGARGPHNFGGSLAASFVQGGLVADLIIGADRQNVRGLRGTGLINQLANSLSGPQAAGSRTIHLDAAGVKGEAESNAQFGFELS